MMRLLTLSLFLLFFGTATAADELEIIPLHYRTAAELLPIIEPQLDPDTRLSGHEDQLIVRGSEADRRAVRTLLRALDTPPRNLMISLKTDTRASSRLSGGQVSGRIGSGGSSARVEIYNSESARAGAGQSQVRGLEGRAARFTQGVLLPVRSRTVWQGQESSGMRNDTRFIELERGFYVTPRLQGDQVVLEVAAATGQGLEQTEIVTTVSGRLGEWIPLAATHEVSDLDGRGLILRSESARQDRQQAWIRVEALD